jgi:type IV secretory pathway component VirB8
MGNLSARMLKRHCAFVYYTRAVLVVAVAVVVIVIVVPIDVVIIVVVAINNKGGTQHKR